MAETIKTQIRKIKVRNDAFNAFLPFPETLKDIDFKKGGVTTIILEEDDPFLQGGQYSRLNTAFELEEAKKLVGQGVQKFVSKVNNRILREASQRNFVNPQRNFVYQSAPSIKLTKLGFKKTGAEGYTAYFNFFAKGGVPCTKKINRASVEITKNVYEAEGKWYIFGMFIMRAEIEKLIVSNTKKNQEKCPELIGSDFYVWKELQF